MHLAGQWWDPAGTKAGAGAREELLDGLARSYRPDEPVPYVEYTPEESARWARHAARLTALQAQCGSRDFLEGAARLRLDGASVAQLGRINRVIGGLPRFRMIPAADGAWRGFFSALADGAFPAVLQIRQQPELGPGESDLVLAALGFAPLLAQPRFAQLARLFGEAGRRADETLLVGLSRAWQWAFGYGVAAEGPALRLVGARLLTSEAHMLRRASELTLRAFDPAELAATPITADTAAHVRFVAEDVSRMLHELERWLAPLSRR